MFKLGGSEYLKSHEQGKMFQMEIIKGGNPAVRIIFLR